MTTLSSQSFDWQQLPRHIISQTCRQISDPVYKLTILPKVNWSLHQLCHTPTNWNVHEVKVTIDGFDNTIVVRQIDKSGKTWVVARSRKDTHRNSPFMNDIGRYYLPMAATSMRHLAEISVDTACITTVNVIRSSIPPLEFSRLESIRSSFRLSAPHQDYNLLHNEQLIYIRKCQGTLQHITGNCFYLLSPSVPYVQTAQRLMKELTKSAINLKSLSIALIGPGPRIPELDPPEQSNSQVFDEMMRQLQPNLEHLTFRSEGTLHLTSTHLGQILETLPSSDTAEANLRITDFVNCRDEASFTRMCTKLAHNNMGSLRLCEVFLKTESQCEPLVQLLTVLRHNACKITRIDLQLWAHSENNTFQMLMDTEEEVGSIPIDQWCQVIQDLISRDPGSPEQDVLDLRCCSAKYIRRSCEAIGSMRDTPYNYNVDFRSWGEQYSTVKLRVGSTIRVVIGLNAGGADQ